MADGSSAPLNILHVLRAPVGGLFRHVADLARGQAARGHRVGLIADSSTGGPQAEATLAALAKVLTHGLTRIPMSRHIGARDILAVRHVAQRAEAAAVDVIHGHGAKGGAYARLARSLPSSASGGGKGRGIRAYTPHGGSLHYRWGSPTGLFYLSAERALMRHTDLFLFESTYGRDIFRAKIDSKIDNKIDSKIGTEIGAPKGLVRVIYNGVTDDEFQPIVVGEGATDLLFVGELRLLKGVDVLIAAIKKLTQDGRSLSATIVGDGPDRARFEREVAKQGVSDKVRFIGAKPARAALALGRLLVVPSRAESLPYIVLEAAAAGVPMIASRVGGMPEIFGPDAGLLVPPSDPSALARAMTQALQDRGARHSTTLRLKARIRALFSADAMTDAVIAAYREARGVG